MSGFVEDRVDKALIWTFGRIEGKYGTFAAIAFMLILIGWFVGIFASLTVYSYFVLESFPLTIGNAMMLALLVGGIHSIMTAGSDEVFDIGIYELYNQDMTEGSTDEK